MGESNERLRQARVAAGFPTATSAAKRYGWTTSTYLSHENGQTPVPVEQAHRYAEKFKCSPAWILTGEGVPPAVRPSMMADIQPVRSLDDFEADAEAMIRGRSFGRVPVLGYAVGGSDNGYIFNGEVLDEVERPPGLEFVKKAYAVYIAGESMYPRYRPGDLVYVNPSIFPSKGADVVVQAKYRDDEPPHGFIKTYDWRSATTLYLTQLNPEKTIEVQLDKLISIHPIVWVRHR